MKKFFTFVFMGLFCITGATAAVRGERAVNREKNTTTTSRIQTNRTAKNISTNNVNARSGQITTRKNTAQNQSVISRDTSRASRTPTSRVATNTKRQNVTPRAATNTAQTTISETRTGTEYEQCKTAFFTCMDQFCTLKNDAFQRCSCSDRVYDFQEISERYQKASENLTEFAENLDVVGMSATQATAMKTASEGENALTEDKSASKQLLQAIMNAIQGKDSSVGGKYKDLNKITISSDVSNAFGLDDSGQIIASYDGTTLYKAVYPKCRTIVQEDCNNASLQRAVNAYLMAIEQDCNTVESALKKQQKTLKNATHENSALLDLARVENRQKHNSDDIAACVSNLEAAITSEEVCGEKYHKCLDYGQFIDVTTGAPLTGVIDFFQLGELLTFKTAENLQNQKLSSISNNRDFVNFFENKTKKFASSVLDKCRDDADTAWQEYLDMALIDIYYAQQSKVDEIEQSCFDLVTACYNNQTAAITSAMANLTGDVSILLKPAEINLTGQLCDNYIESCNNMFSGNIVKTYLANKDSFDSENACRAIAQQCFDKFGGLGYENFYLPQSGLFNIGEAIDWFSLYDAKNNLVSPCAQELAATEGCGKPELLEKVFGGFDKKTIDGKTVYTIDDTEDRKIRPRGVASETYAKIINNLSNQCAGLDGYFIEHQYAALYGYNENNFCQINTSSQNSVFYINELYNSPRDLHYWYHFVPNENVCPAGYIAKTDVQSWGACSCWENGGYRSKNGTVEICRPLLPIANTNGNDDQMCTADLLSGTLSVNPDENQWCQQPLKSSLEQVCPDMYILTKPNAQYALCAYRNGDTKEVIDVVLESVPQHKVTETVLSEITTWAQQNKTEEITQAER